MKCLDRVTDEIPIQAMAIADVSDRNTCKTVGMQSRDALRNNRPIGRKKCLVVHRRDIAFIIAIAFKICVWWAREEKIILHSVREYRADVLAIATLPNGVDAMHHTVWRCTAFCLVVVIEFLPCRTRHGRRDISSSLVKMVRDPCRVVRTK